MEDGRGAAIAGAEGPVAQQQTGDSPSSRERPKKTGLLSCWCCRSKQHESPDAGHNVAPVHTRHMSAARRMSVNLDPVEEGSEGNWSQASAMNLGLVRADESNSMRRSLKEPLRDEGRDGIKVSAIPTATYTADGSTELKKQSYSIAPPKRKSKSPPPPAPAFATTFREEDEEEGLDDGNLFVMDIGSARLPSSRMVGRKNSHAADSPFKGTAPAAGPIDVPGAGAGKGLMSHLLFEDTPGPEGPGGKGHLSPSVLEAAIVVPAKGATGENTTVEAADLRSAELLMGGQAGSKPRAVRSLWAPEQSMQPSLTIFSSNNEDADEGGESEEKGAPPQPSRRKGDKSPGKGQRGGIEGMTSYGVDLTHALRGRDALAPRVEEDMPSISLSDMDMEIARGSEVSREEDFQQKALKIQYQKQQQERAERERRAADANKSQARMESLKQQQQQALNLQQPDALKVARRKSTPRVLEALVTRNTSSPKAAASPKASSSKQPFPTWTSDLPTQENVTNLPARQPTAPPSSPHSAKGRDVAEARPEARHPIPPSEVLQQYQPIQGGAGPAPPPREITPPPAASLEQFVSPTVPLRRFAPKGQETTPPAHRPAASSEERNRPVRRSEMTGLAVEDPHSPLLQFRKRPNRSPSPVPEGYQHYSPAPQPATGALGNRGPSPSALGGDSNRDSYLLGGGAKGGQPLHSASNGLPPGGAFIQWLNDGNAPKDNRGASPLEVGSGRGALSPFESNNTREDRVVSPYDRRASPYGGSKGGATQEANAAAALPAERAQRNTHDVAHNLYGAVRQYAQINELKRSPPRAPPERQGPQYRETSVTTAPPPPRHVVNANANLPINPLDTTKDQMRKLPTASPAPPMRDPANVNLAGAGGGQPWTGWKQEKVAGDYDPVHMGEDALIAPSADAISNRRSHESIPEPSAEALWELAVRTADADPPPPPTPNHPTASNTVISPVALQTVSQAPSRESTSAPSPTISTPPRGVTGKQCIAAGVASGPSLPAPPRLSTAAGSVPAAAAAPTVPRLSLDWVLRARERELNPEMPSGRVMALPTDGGGEPGGGSLGYSSSDLSDTTGGSFTPRRLAWLGEGASQGGGSQSPSIGGVSPASKGGSVTTG